MSFASGHVSLTFAIHNHNDQLKWVQLVWNRITSRCLLFNCAENREKGKI